MNPTVPVDRPVVQADDRWTTLRSAAGAWRRTPRLAAIAWGALVVQQAFTIGFAFSLKDIVGDVTDHRPESRLVKLLVILAVGFAASVGSAVVGERATGRASASITNEMRRTLYARLLQLSPAFLSTTSAARVNRRFTNDLKSVEGGYVTGFLDTVTIVADAVIAIPLLALLDVPLAVVTAVALPLVIFGVDRLLPRYVQASGAASASELALMNAVQDTVHAHDVVRSFHLEPILTERFDDLLVEHESRMVEQRSSVALVTKGASLAVLLVEVIVVMAGAELAAHQHLSVSSLVAFVTVVGLLSKNVYDYVRTDLPLLAEAGRGRRGLDNLLTAPIVVTDAEDAAELRVSAGAIHADEVTFTYPTASSPALDSLTVSIAAGTSVAVVGSNGAGKSTLLRLLMRYYDPQAGSISIDGWDLRSVTQRSLRAQMSFVLQGNFVFNDSIRDNIRIGRPDADDDDVVEGARLAELHEIVMRFPDGYGTVVADSGGRLSAGHRQRLAIARAMLRDPSILLLDEVTTALDPVTETAIHDMLARAGRGRTVVSATHRLAAAQQADLILVLDDGRLVERGQHQELVGAGGTYQRLWEKQSGFAVRGDGRSATVDAARLRHVTLFADLDDATLDRIAGNLVSDFYEPDQTVFEEGDPGDRFYLIARGRVAVVTHGPEDETHVLETLGDGDHFGELALLQDRPRTATIRTTAPSVFLTMDRQSFLDLVATTPEMTRMLEERMIRSELNLGEWSRLVGRD